MSWLFCDWESYRGTLSAYSNPMSLKSSAKSTAIKACKWYIRGWRHTPGVPLIRSPAMGRLMLTLIVIRGVTLPFDTERTSLTATSSSVPPTSASSPSYVLTESEAYRKCRNHFATQLELPYKSPIYTLDSSLTSLVVNESSTNGGKVTQLGNGETIVAGQALIEQDESAIKTRHFICTLETSTGKFSSLIRGKDSSWQ